MAIKKSFMTGMLDYFGKQPGQTTQGFADEIKALTPQDKVDFATGLEANGYEITDKSGLEAGLKAA